MSHPRVHVCFGAFDVVVEVVSKQLDPVDRRLRLVGGCKVSREEDYRGQHTRDEQQYRRLDGSPNVT